MNTIKLNHEYVSKSGWSKDAYGMERVVFYTTFFEADYYGKSAKMYAKGYNRIEYTTNGQTSIGPAYGHWQDGNPTAIKNLIALTRAQ